MGRRVDEAAGEMRAALARYCEAMHDLTADGRWRSAAGMLRGGRAGRPAVDDAAAIAFARQLLSTGMAKSLNRACAISAQMHAPTSAKVEAMRDRLRRKLRRSLNVSKEDNPIT